MNYDFIGAVGTPLSQHMPEARYEPANSTSGFENLQLDGNGGLVKVSNGVSAFVIDGASSILIGLPSTYVTNTITFILKAGETAKGYTGRLQLADGKLSKVTLASNGGYAGNIIISPSIDFSSGNVDVQFSFDSADNKIEVVALESGVEVFRASSVRTDVPADVNAGVALGEGAVIYKLETDLAAPEILFSDVPSTVRNNEVFTFSVTTELEVTTANSTVTLGGSVLSIESLSSTGNEHTYTCSLPKYAPLTFGASKELELDIGGDSATNYSVNYQPTTGYLFTVIDGAISGEGSALNGYVGAPPEDGGQLVYESHLRTATDVNVSVAPSGNISFDGDVTSTDSFSRYVISPNGEVGGEAIYTVQVDAESVSSTFNPLFNGVPDGTYMTVLDKEDGTRVSRQYRDIFNNRFVPAVSIPDELAGVKIKGYFDDNLDNSVHGVYIEGVTV